MRGLLLAALLWQGQGLQPLNQPLPSTAPAPNRMALPHLERVHEDVKRLQALPRTPPPPGRYRDVRAVLHAHSHLSHDSRGTPEEIIAGAKQAGVVVVFMTDHYTPDRRFLREALRGTHDGVLFIPGAELSQGLLTFRMEKAQWPENATDTEVLKALNAAGGVGFVAHPEQRKEWDLPFTGMEIYNTHADAEDNAKEGLPALQGSGGLSAWLPLVEAAQRYPRELFASIFDPPTANLAVWDRLNRTRRVVGIAGNDSHQNVGVTLLGGEGGRLEVVDALGKVLARPRSSELPPLLFPGGAVPGQPLMKLQLDPYAVSFGYVSTHLMARAVTEAACFEALTRGRCYVAFDWLADPTGFRFTGRAGRHRLEMGDEIKAREVTLLAETPLPAEIRLLRDGREIARGTGTRLEKTVHEPGVYRVEAWQTVAGEGRPWVYSNPIYLRRPHDADASPRPSGTPLPQPRRERGLASSAFRLRPLSTRFSWRGVPEGRGEARIHGQASSICRLPPSRVTALPAPAANSRQPPTPTPRAVRCGPPRVPSRQRRSGGADRRHAAVLATAATGAAPGSARS